LVAVANWGRRESFGKKSLTISGVTGITDIDRMTALARMKLPHLKDFGNAKSSPPRLRQACLGWPIFAFDKLASAGRFFLSASRGCAARRESGHDQRICNPYTVI
jgi:hypothetical protein